MRKLLIFVLAATALWSGYWLIGARAAESAIRSWLDSQTARGVADYAEVATRGFPNRFDTTISEPEFFDPVSGTGWTAPFLQIFALSYRPNHIIAVWPNDQTLILPGERITVQSDRMRGSVVFEVDTALTLDRFTFVIDALELGSDAGWQAAADEFRLATRQTAARENHHDLGVEATAIRLGDTLTAALDPEAALPATIESARLDATLGFDAPWDRLAAEGPPPSLTAIELNAFRATWGDVALSATGGVTLNRGGVPEGRIDIVTEGWRTVLTLATAAGLVDPAIQPTVENALELLTQLDGSPDALAVPLSFKHGSMSLGPIPLGSAPRLTGG